MILVRCNKCGWIGKDDQLGFYYNADTEYCPKCKNVDALTNLDDGNRFEKNELEKLWEFFGEIPVNENDEIEEEFLGFPEGVHKEDVWHWFDEKYPDGVCQLMMRGE